MSIVLSDICVYPVKALAGLSRRTSRVETIGLAGDRRWLIVDGEGRFISQRTHPQLARISAEVGDDGILLETPDHPPLRVDRPDGRERLQVGIWRDQVDAAAAGNEADQWFSDLLNKPCRFAWLDDPTARPLATAGAAADSAVSFADGYPCLLASVSSLADLNGRMTQPVPMSRFRANLVVSGSRPFAEDNWERIRVGSAVFRNAGPCARCSVTTVDQATGLAHAPEPLRTLETFRRSAEGVIFGVNLIVETAGVVTTGDIISVEE